ncbi:OLC1v1024454C1 [Oldenlandia corymbosa var. corymbosa]|uniref:OLC1v1024454C1 n=1 Tax=Oldenlandia corymbosa var. corymbosa TaxID=529605 RepID=A0AAV1C580_OLDCO|nr:OLC1v1024454C1 [Oldenlandia corymbosa var. corymbosa]
MYTQQVIYERALRISAIRTSTSIDVAKIIREQMTGWVTDPTVRNWYFPVSVTLLCGQADVLFVARDVHKTIPRSWSYRTLARDRPPREEPPPITGVRRKHLTKQHKYMLDYIHCTATWLDAPVTPTSSHHHIPLMG